jgi:hypothetical protein
LLIVPEAGKSNIKEATDSVSGKDLLIKDENSSVFTWYKGPQLPPPLLTEH